MLEFYVKKKNLTTPKKIPLELLSISPPPPLLPTPPPTVTPSGQIEISPFILSGEASDRK